MADIQLDKCNPRTLEYQNIRTNLRILGQAEFKFHIEAKGFPP